ncbi:MAG: hypothetical protein AAFR77_00450 [Cyanobacteria bacterium J06631_2]
MNKPATPDTNFVENQNYEDLSLKELKEIARNRQLIPEGNKTKKDTWISALTADDSALANKTIESNAIQLIGAALIDESQPSTNQTEPEDLEDLEDLTVGSAQKNTNEPQSSPNQSESEDLTIESRKSEEAENYILENIVTALDQRRVDVNQLQVNFDGQNIFKMDKGEIANSTVTNQQKDLIEQALNDPQSFKGSLKITNGSQVLLHVKDGQVLRDGLNLTKTSTKLEINSPSADLYDKYAKNITSKGLQTTKDVAKNALADGISREETAQIIKSRDSSYRELSASTGQERADKTLNRIVASASAEIKNRRSQSVRREEKSLSISR